MKFEITVLGSGSALPTLSRNPSAQILNINERLILVDCGEGTQVQLRKANIKFQRIDLICITHLHGDHYFGLIGLLNTMELLGRKKHLKIISPKGLKEILTLQMKYAKSYFNFSIEYIEVNQDSDHLVFEDDHISVKKLPLKHRIECYGYRFDEKPKSPNIEKDAITRYEIPFSEIPNIKKGKDYVDKRGNIIKNEKLVSKPKPSWSYAYCSDTMFNEELVDHLKGVDLLYHESTFLDSEKDRAKKTGHSTASQAAEMANLCDSRALMLGHYSIRYMDLNKFKEEAAMVYQGPIILSDSGTKILISNTIEVIT
ncbi:MAG: ribonuclease Z [Flavobacteriales bacterium]|nr:ribonuclease Z [Flavobacteriales bacterium]